MSEAKDGYTRKEMYDDKYDDIGMIPVDWPPKDQSEAAYNHRRRLSRIKRDENTR